MTRLVPLSVLLVLCCLSGIAVQNTDAYYYYYPTSYYYYPYTYSYYGYYYPYYSYYGKREANWNDSPDQQHKSSQNPPMYGQQAPQQMPPQQSNGQQGQEPQYNIMPVYRNQN